jgi:predicted PolB exonuclease-like 3'-5' exonuclease
MIRTEYFDEFDRITTLEHATYIVCIETDYNGNEISRKIIQIGESKKKEFQSHSFLDHHWENAISTQKIIDNLWKLYHKVTGDDKKLAIIDRLLQSYENLDVLFDRIESRQHRRNRHE